MVFTDVTPMSGLATTTLPMLGWGTNFLDHDRDGDLDLFVANGHTYPQIDRVSLGTSYRQRNQLFDNVGGRFEDVSARSGPGLAAEQVSRGACFGDYDNDGDTDVFVVNMDAPPTLLRNDGGKGRGSLTVQLVGSGGNRDALGARIRLTAAGRTQTRFVNGARPHGGAPRRNLVVPLPGRRLACRAHLAVGVQGAVLAG
jgi:hypothetical protein